MSITLRKEVLMKYPNSTFIETGTFKGGGVRLALECGFPRIHSIEIDPILHEQCDREFQKYDNVFIHLGDSIQLLPSILQFCPNPVTFWLDAHIQESCVLGEFPVPLIQELMLLCKYRQGINDTVLVDDRRLFGQGSWWKGTNEIDIIQLLEQAYPNNKFTTEDSNAAEKDILVCYYAPESLEEFIQTNQNNPAYGEE